jgi:hypothetical protein
VEALAAELDAYHESKDFSGLPTMADLVIHHLDRLLTDEIHE